MEKEQIHKIVEAQKRFFETGCTLSIDFRRKALTDLKTCLTKNEGLIAQALAADLGKSPMEGYMCETGMVISEISYMLKHLKRFAKERRVKTPLAQFPAKSYVKPCPYGTVLIMSPWNYPLLLTLAPLVDALSAGNTAVVKPSAYSSHTSTLLKELLQELYPEEYVAVIMGGREENSWLLYEKFDSIFFTGSKTVGIEVMKRAAENLTPITLELGGKSPCVVDKTANLSLAARRIVFGKYLNCGQTCVAPDYVLCHKDVKEELLRHIKEEIVLQYGEQPLSDPLYGKIINRKHFERILKMMDREAIVFGGEFCEETLQIAPTVLDDVTVRDAVMQEEIFGPLLPVLTFEDTEEVLCFIKGFDRPLALYLFSSDKRMTRRILSECRFGGGCVNDTIVHLATSHMGFGGVGESGMGGYHGKVGFEAFSHLKSIVSKSTHVDLPMRYRQNCKRSERLIRKFLK